MATTTSKKKTILITGSTDGIGLAAAKKLHSMGHTVLLHGRDPQKLQRVLRSDFIDVASSSSSSGANNSSNAVETYVADFSYPEQVEDMAKQILMKHSKIDVLINNAGIFKRTTTPTTTTTKDDNDLDVRFAVNAISPYLLTRRLLPIIIRMPVVGNTTTTTNNNNNRADNNGRIVNIVSIAHRHCTDSGVDLELMRGKKEARDNFEAYSQSKLATVAWTNYFARGGEAQQSSSIVCNEEDEDENDHHHEHNNNNSNNNHQHRDDEIVIKNNNNNKDNIDVFSVHPGSWLDTKMVREGGLPHLRTQSVDKGRDILVRAAIDTDSFFANANGKYFDNDSGAFGPPHKDAEDPDICRSIVATMNDILAERDIHVVS